MNLSFICIALTLIAVFENVDSKPYLSNEQWDTFVDQRGDKQDFVETTESLTVPTEALKEFKTINQSEDLSMFIDFAAFAKWLADKDDSNAKTLRFLMAKGMEIIKQNPWKQNGDLISIPDLGNIVVEQKGEGNALSTPPTLEVGEVKSNMDYGEDYKSNPDILKVLNEKFDY